jgi:hypothetical protein
MSLKPICVKCHRFYRCKKNGFDFVEGMPAHDGAPPGIEHDAEWQDYKVWQGDLWECKGCGHLLISGVGMKPFSERHDPDFAAVVERTWLRVNDC